MTEAEWLACGNPRPMLEFLRGKMSERKMRLFAVACCRKIWFLLMAERSRQGIEIAEQYVDGLVGEDRLLEPWPVGGNYPELPGQSSQDENKAARFAWDAAQMAGARPRGSADIHVLLREVMYYSAGAMAWHIVGFAGTLYSASAWAEAWNNVEADEYQEQTKFMRDIFGNPFRPINLTPSLLTSKVVSFATQMYESRDFSAMPLLADALNDAGCDNTDILNHCRQPGEHVRGCWVIDRLLGKE
jgi:hypothetical protein